MILVAATAAALAVGLIGCPPCRATYSPTDTLGSIDDPASPGPTAEVLRLVDGGYLVTSESMRTMVLRYGSNGRYLSTVGAPGHGPGEFGGPVAFSGGRSAIAIRELRSPVVHLFEHDLTFRKTVRLPGPVWSMASRAEGGWLAASFAAGRAIQVLDSVGDTEVALASAQEPNNLGALVRYLAEGEGGTVWSVTMSGLVEVYRQDGARAASAFQMSALGIGGPVPERVHRGGQLPTVVTDIAWDAGGFLWVFVSTPDERGTERTPGRPAPEEILDTVVFFATLIDGRIVVAEGGRFDGLVRPLGGGWAYDLVDVPSGDRRVRVGRLNAVSVTP